MNRRQFVCDCPLSTFIKNVKKMSNLHTNENQSSPMAVHDAVRNCDAQLIYSEDVWFVVPIVSSWTDLLCVPYIYLCL